MTDVPDLTHEEAAALRVLLLTDRDRLRLDKLANPYASDRHIAALAAYDAKERAKIRVEAMRECEAIAAEFIKHGRIDEPYEAFEDLLSDIRALIAKEQA